MKHIESNLLKADGEGSGADGVDAREWEEFAQEMKNIKIILDKRAEEKFGSNSKEWLSQRIDDFACDIRKDNPDWEKYVAYHELVGSSAPRAQSPRLDFSGRYSVKDFCIKLISELIAK